MTSTLLYYGSPWTLANFGEGIGVYDAFIALLAGAHGLVEINKRLRADPGLQAAFGRTACAEQSVVQETLDTCTDANVVQMHQAMDTIYRQHSRGYRHDYTRSLQVLDADMTGMPCGKRPPVPPKATLPSSATAVDDNWARYWPPAMTQSSWIGSLAAQRS